MIGERRLLILSCSQRKRPDPDLLPAVERYNGPSYQVLRRYLRESAKASLLDVYILSAAYGLIPSDYPIPDYNQKMTPECAAELRDCVGGMFLQVLQKNGYESICLAMSKLYLSVLAGGESSIPHGVSVTVTGGSQGAKLAQLKHWLWGDTSDSTNQQ